jgi:hypothetical protein
MTLSLTDINRIRVHYTMPLMLIKKLDGTGHPTGLQQIITIHRKQIPALSLPDGCIAGRCQTLVLLMYHFHPAIFEQRQLLQRLRIVRAVIYDYMLKGNSFERTNYTMAHFLKKATVIITGRDDREINRHT